MTPIDLPFSLPGFEVDEVAEQDGLIEITAHSRESEAICPACQHLSARVHSYYQRAPADLPIAGRGVRLQLTARRFRCQNPTCTRVTFAERRPELLAVHAQRTERLRVAIRAIAFALGGQAGSRLTASLTMPASGDTLLRIIRSTPCPLRASPEILGIDDWAKRRGRAYGTILVDLKSHTVVD